MSWRLLGMLDDVECASPTAKLILVKLVDRADDDGKNIYPSIARIAAFAGCSERQTKRVMGAFCAVGLLRVVKEGGKGPGSTRHYELSIDMLRRMASESWESIAGSHAQDACNDDDEGADSPLAKGDTMSPLEAVRVTPATSKGDTHVTQTLREPSEFEREGAGASAGTQAGQADAPDAGHAADAEGGTATLAEFRKRWPTTAADDNRLVEGAWAALAFEDRKAAIDGIRAYVAEIKRIGRRHIPAGSNYLAQRKWLDVPALVAERQGTAMQQVAPWSRDWWLCLFDRLLSGRTGSLLVQWAEGGKGLTERQNELDAMKARVGELATYLCDGPEIEAWRPWLAAKGARIPDFSGRSFRVFLPGPFPPGGRRDEGDDDVRFSE